MHYLLYAQQSQLEVMSLFGGLDLPRCVFFSYSTCILQYTSTLHMNGISSNIRKLLGVLCSKIFAIRCSFGVQLNRFIEGNGQLRFFVCFKEFGLWRQECVVLLLLMVDFVFSSSFFSLQENCTELGTLLKLKTVS